MDIHRWLYNFSMTSKANITADPTISMRRLASEMKLAPETVRRAVKAVVMLRSYDRTTMYFLIEEMKTI